MPGRFRSYERSGLAAELPSAAMVHELLTDKAGASFYATDTDTLYCLDRAGTPAWKVLGGVSRAKMDFYCG